MDLDVYTYAVFAAVAVLAVSFVWLCKRRQAVGGPDPRKLVEGQKAEVEFAAAAEAAMLDLKASVEGLATCLANMELRMRTVDQRQRKFDDMATQFARRRGFDEALNMLRDGKPAAEIARSCALPLAEAQLLSRIHQQSATH